MKVVCYLEHTSLSIVKIIRNFDGFKWFPSPRSLIGLQNSCHSLSQSDAQLKPIAIWSWVLLLLLRSNAVIAFAFVLQHSIEMLLMDAWAQIPSHIRPQIQHQTKRADWSILDSITLRKNTKIIFLLTSSTTSTVMIATRITLKSNQKYQYHPLPWLQYNDLSYK